MTCGRLFIHDAVAKDFKAITTAQKNNNFAKVKEPKNTLFTIPARIMEFKKLNRKRTFNEAFICE